MFLSVKQFVAKAAVIGAGLVASCVAGAGTLNIIGCDSFTGDISTGTITCVPGGTVSPPPPPSPTAPSGCSATASPSAFPTALGGTVQLTASCSSGAAVATATWTRTRSGLATQVSAPDTTLPDNGNASTSAVYTYTARLCAADGTSCTNATTGTVTVPAGIAPPPTTSSCGSIPIIQPIYERTGTSQDIAFTGERYVSNGFTGSNVVVGTIRVPEGASGTTKLSVFEYIGVTTSRRVWLSKTRCDMSATSGPTTASNSTPNIYIKVGGTPSSWEVGMKPGETWYVMIKNEAYAPGGVIKNSCTTTCDIGIKLYGVN